MFALFILYFTFLPFLKKLVGENKGPFPCTITNKSINLASKVEPLKCIFRHDILYIFIYLVIY